MQTSPNSSPFAYRLSEEDAASVAALRAEAIRFKAQGLNKLAWYSSVRGCEIVNRAMLQKLESGDYASDEELYYTEVPEGYPAQGNKGLQLNLSLIAGSDLAEKIIVLLKEYTDEHSRI